MGTTTMIDTILKLFVLLPAALGLFVLWHIFRPQQKPADESNRINKIRLVWFALTREELFVDKFPWLLNDELKNVNK